MIRVAIVDDHAVVRRGLRQILAEAGDIEVAGESQDYAGIVPLLRDDAPDVVLLDISMPGRSGIDILKSLKELYPKVAVLILSMYPEDQYGMRALKGGAAGYLNKDAAPEHLVDAVRRAAGGRKYISPALAAILAERLGEPAQGAPHERLSDREFETLKLIAGGHRLSEIALLMHLSPKTVSVYRARLLEKMGLHTNTELTRYAIKNDLID